VFYIYTQLTFTNQVTSRWKLCSG